MFPSRALLERAETMVAADLWIEESPPRRFDWGPLAAALGLGLILGAAVTAFAGDRWIAPEEAPAVAERTWPHRALDREWRGTRTPVDVDRMFRQTRR